MAELFLSIPDGVTIDSYPLDALTQATAASFRTAVGIGSIDNTSDASKPVSTATQTALDAKAAKVGLKFYMRDTQATPHYWQLTDVVTGTAAWTDRGTSLPSDGIVIYA